MTHPTRSNLTTGLGLVAVLFFAGGSTCYTGEGPPDLAGMFDGCNPGTQCCSAEGECLSGSQCWLGPGQNGVCGVKGSILSGGACGCAHPPDDFGAPTVETELSMGDVGTPADLGVLKKFHKKFRDAAASPDVDAFLQQYCDQGVGDSCGWLGQRVGAGPNGDHPRAADLIRRGCMLGSASSCFYFAAALRLGRGVPHDDEAALAFLDAACSGGQQLACSPQAAFDLIDQHAEF